MDEEIKLRETLGADNIGKYTESEISNLIDEIKYPNIKYLRKHYSKHNKESLPLNDSDFQIEKIKDFSLRSKESELSKIIQIDKELFELEKDMDVIQEHMKKLKYTDKRFKKLIELLSQTHERHEIIREKKTGKLKNIRKNKYTKKRKGKKTSKKKHKKK